MDKERLRLALLGTAIVSLAIYLLSYWGPNYGETKDEALATAEEAQHERPGKAAAQEREEKTTEGGGRYEPKGDKTGEHKEAGTGNESSDRSAAGSNPGTGTGEATEGTVQESLGSRKEDSESAAGTDTQSTTVREAPVLRRGDICGNPGYSSDSLNYLATFKITAYTAGPESTGKTPDHPEYGITYSGKRVKEGVTAAADLNVLPLGSIVYIEGVGCRTIQDKGGAVKGNHLDIYIKDLDAALDWGVRDRAVYLIKEGGADNG